MKTIAEYTQLYEEISNWFQEYHGEIENKIFPLEDHFPEVFTKEVCEGYEKARTASIEYELSIFDKINELKRGLEATAQTGGDKK